MAESFVGKTDTGKQRQNNEDTYLIESLNGGKLVAGCVIDGVGGYAGGEVAADIAKKTIQSQLKQIEENPIAVMKSAFLAANKKIIHEKQSNPKNAQMACVATMALADIEHNKFYYAHVGDTRLYLFRDGSLVKVSRDHSVVGFLEESGRLTEEAAMQHPRRNEINKALGFEHSVVEKDDFIETGESPFLPGDIILLCSDGLTDMIGHAAITDILKFKATLKIKAKMLIDSANNAGGKDNITVVLIQNSKSRQQLEATKPVNSTKSEDALVAPVNPSEPAQRASTLQVPPVKSSRGIIALLTVLCIAFFVAFLWVLLKDTGKKDEPVVKTEPIVVRQQSPEELALISSFKDSAAQIINLQNSGVPIVITDSIVISRESMIINGRGATIRSDSSYRGAAFVVPAIIRYLQIDSVTFENFDVALLTRTPGLVMRGVRFKNCRVPVVVEMLLPSEQQISGKINNNIFEKVDSIPGNTR
jgi:PPM family protein phosphatase